MVIAHKLHLASLTIQGFRGVNELTIPRLGQVTLLAGMNGVGKTTVLDALQVYAARGQYAALTSLFRRREESSVATDEDNDSISVPDWRSLFYRRKIDKGASISIGPIDGSKLVVKPTDLREGQGDFFSHMFLEFQEDTPFHAIQVEFAQHRQVLPWVVPFEETDSTSGYGLAYARLTRELRRFAESNRFPGSGTLPPIVRCESLGPGVVGNADLVRFWDSVALTDDEELAVDALRLIFGDSVQRVAIVGDDGFAGRRIGRRAVVRLKSQTHPVPLKSLGDGAVRLFGVALALANSKDGFLLIDEAENGIHHSVQIDFWRMILETARQNNVQVVATTHSWDCIRGFAHAVNEVEGADGLLVRLEKEEAVLRPIEYSRADLRVVAEQGIEVR